MSRTYSTPAGTSAWAKTSGANSTPAATPLTTNSAILMAANTQYSYFVTGLQFTNFSATSSVVFLFDGNTCIWSDHAPVGNNVPYVVDFSASPLHGTVNNALTLWCLPSANLLYNIQGYIGT